MNFLKEFKPMASAPDDSSLNSHNFMNFNYEYIVYIIN